jgi:ribosome-associated toxin RatA of RatAB toxin-antitoxin module
MPEMKILAFAFAIAVVAAAPAARAAEDQDISVTLERRGEQIVVEARMVVAATPSEAWDVLTDYAHMAAFVSNLKSSAILARNGNRLEVEQIGEARRGPFKYAFETVREVVLDPPREIRSSLVRGPFRSYKFVTRIVDRGDSVLIVNNGEYEPTTWVPPVVGPAMIETETRKQFGELRREILRRKGAVAATR